MILKLTPNTHPILHERVKSCSDNLDRREISRILKENMFYYLLLVPVLLGEVQLLDGEKNSSLRSVIKY